MLKIECWFYKFKFWILKFDLEGEVNMYERNIKILIYYIKIKCLWGGGGVCMRGIVVVYELLVNFVGY